MRKVDKGVKSSYIQIFPECLLWVRHFLDDLSYKNELNAEVKKIYKPELTRIRKKIKRSVTAESVREVVWLLTLCGQGRFLYRVIFVVKHELNKRSRPADVGGKNACQRHSQCISAQTGLRKHTGGAREGTEQGREGCTVWGRSPSPGRTPRSSQNGK